MADHRFEAWRNFILIFAGVLVGNMLNYYIAIRDATIYLLEYDRPLMSALLNMNAPDLMAGIICLYFFKSIHGVLVTIFDDAYRRSLVGDETRAMISCGLMTAVVLSLGFVGLLANNVFQQRYPVHAGMAYVLMASPPIVVFLIFDVFHHVLRRGFVPRIPWSRLFASDKNGDEIRGTWLLEDYSSATILIILLVFLLLPNIGNTMIILATVVAVFIATAVNSLFDYIANRGFFFSFVGSPPPPPFGANGDA